MKKVKIYVLTVSTHFPVTHKKKGQPTNFPDLIKDEIKKHTIRSNFDLWSQRIREVTEGKAIISVRYWSGKPYQSKQVEILQLDQTSGMSFTGFTFRQRDITKPYLFSSRRSALVNDIPIETIAGNDGLFLDDFKEWFKKYDLSKNMILIYFSKFRY